MLTRVHAFTQLIAGAVLDVRAQVGCGVRLNERTRGCAYYAWESTPSGRLVPAQLAEPRGQHRKNSIENPPEK